MHKGYRNAPYYTVLLGLYPTKGSSAFSHGLSMFSHSPAEARPTRTSAALT